ncbi:MAG: DUF1297 domain-containing protein [Patescibacteria group bacterium]|nr:DUF1297 domain-containing protein [Patescibacteria group bacterium]
MITQKDIQEILKNYDTSQITIGALGGHSALDVCHGAKKYGFRTVVVAQKGREKTFAKYYKTRGGKGCVDEVIVVDKFSDIVNEDIQEKLRALNTIFIHSRYFWVYFDDFSKVENEFRVPIMGLRQGVRLEERDQPLNQYHLLEKAGIKIPKIYKKPKDIDRLVIVKVNEELRGYERAFFFASSPEDYRKKADELLEQGMISEESLKNAIIEEYIVGAQVNFNYFYSPLTDELEIMGTDMRRQTNLDGILRLPANEQLELLKHVKPRLIETGHVACTTKESILEKIFELGERFVEIMKKEVPPGMIGPFALQGAIASEEGKEVPVIFDVSMRIPGSPGTRFTPCTGYLYGETISYGERIAMEIKDAMLKNALEKILT